MAAFGAAVGQYLMPGPDGKSLDPYIIGAAFFVCGYGNILNDILDVESDAINHPGRPLPSGKISRPAAAFTAGLFLAISLALMFFLSLAGGFVVILALVLLTLYNIKLKHVGYVGNMIVSLLGGAVLIFGGLAHGVEEALSLPGPVVAAVFAFLIHFGREIIKDIGDREGDAVAGSQTAAASGSMWVPMAIAYTSFALMIFLSVTVYITGWFDRAYLVLAVFGVDLPLVIICIWLAVMPSRRRFVLTASLIKFLMLPGIVALVAGKSF
jgi:geranylgeranylglycerol-phosphate geranylgeranyltransferase